MKPNEEEIKKLITSGEWRAEDFVETDEEHGCPYQADVNNDSTPCCKCSRYQQYECAQDI